VSQTGVDLASRERMGVEEGQLVMPFYLLCDISFSMYREMTALHEGVRRLRQAIVAEPVVDDVAQVCIITFSDTAKVVVPLGPMSASEVPAFTAENLTDYGAAFRTLAQTIDQDRARLLEGGYRIYRPCAFFLTDGLPTDEDWHTTFVKTLTYDPHTGIGMKAHPIFVPFGYRDAHEEILGQLAYPPDRAAWYHAKSQAIETVLKGVLDIIMQTVVSSGRTAGTGRPALLPATPMADSGIIQGASQHRADYHPDFLT
jgi:uncharacterized protein YegL